ncbi:MAG: hypothetical protein ISP92_00230 [Pseudomonadales bacterium]|jgi:hypothetical protein|nr:hypothetical protein [Pseudomonadales bacterium]MDA0760016.1 hypothetical protein [Pseudomonadota bacterium]MDA0956424.1 hypothetical protein [Pseudomonadota bacterium]MDA1206262.1 hypothetical protein [Pseudomonadota bacterium]
MRFYAVLCLFMLMLAPTGLPLAEDSAPNYRLSLQSLKGSERVQATGGQLTFIAQVEPRLFPRHQLKIQSADQTIDALATPGQTVVQGVERGVQTFRLVVIDQDSGAILSESPALKLDVRRFIPR